MPAERGVQVVKGAVAGHEGLAGAAFLAGAAVVADGAGQVVDFEVLFDEHGGQHRAGPEQVVTAPLPWLAGLERLRLGGAGLLAQTSQGIVLAQEADDRAAAAGLGHEGGGDACHVGRDLEALGFHDGDL